MISFGFACLLLWFLNICWTVKQMMKHRDDDEEFDGEKLANRFIARSSGDEIKFMSMLLKYNTHLFYMGAILIIIGVFI